MIPAIDPKKDYKALVSSSYDACAAEYDKARRAEPGTELQALSHRLQEGDAVLDIGCGPGVPIAQSLAERFNVTGVDVSQAMIKRARQNVPAGRFICADVMSCRFQPHSFAAVVAFYAIFHIPREEHPALFRRIHRWLTPGGYLLCTLSQFNEQGYTEDDFFGVTMYWSNYSLEEYRKILSEAGFVLLEVNAMGSGYDEAAQCADENHPLILAQKR